VASFVLLLADKVQEQRRNRSGMLGLDVTFGRARQLWKPLCILVVPGGSKL